MRWILQCLEVEGLHSFEGGGWMASGVGVWRWGFEWVWGAGGVVAKPGHGICSGLGGGDCMTHWRHMGWKWACMG